MEGQREHLGQCPRPGGGGACRRSTAMAVRANSHEKGKTKTSGVREKESRGETERERSSRRAKEVGVGGKSLARRVPAQRSSVR